MSTTTPDSGRPEIRVRLVLDAEQYLEQIRRVRFETLVAGGLTPAAAADWIVKTDREAGAIAPLPDAIVAAIRGGLPFTFEGVDYAPVDRA